MTTEALHTPGPWTLEGDAEPMIVADDNGTKAIIAYLPYAYETTGWTAQNQADADLIAAAPDLLEAAEEALRYVSDDVMQVEAGTKFMVMLAAAYAKATGGQSC